MTVRFDLSSHPLCAYFLSDYLAKREDDEINFPPSEILGLFELYENIFKSALEVLDLPKETLRRRQEFDFSSGNAANLESAIAVLRTVVALHQWKFLGIKLINPPGADIFCEKDGQRVCCEVKTITKQSTARKGFYFADQLYEKTLDHIGKAREQLARSTAEWQCTVTIFVCVVNWFDQSVYLGEDDYQNIVNRLERDQLKGEGNVRESLNGIDGVLFVTKFGNRHLFLNDRGKSIDR
jgi:hypothetical protein